MTNWNEADHPRDNEGKFTFKNGGSVPEKKQSYEEKMQNRADILYPTMNDIKTTNPRREYINMEQKKQPQIYEYNNDYKSIHDTYRNILIDANTYAGKADIEGFKPYYTEANRSTGFYGRAYINEETKTVVIAYKGADPGSITKDWWSNGAKSLFNKIMPSQFKDAERLYSDVINKLGNRAKDYKIDFAGYSLGGNLAQLMGAKYGNETVTYNAFGAGQMKDADINYTDNITNYGHLHDKVFNLSGTNHIGKNIYTKDIGGKEDSFSRHEMENMGDLRFKIKKRP